MRLKTISLLCLFFVTGNAIADIVIFDEKSIGKIQEANEGLRFALILWSLDCPPCLKELREIQTMTPHQQQAIVLISVDGIASQNEANSFLSKAGIKVQSSWIFKYYLDPQSRMLIDKRWFGELPRHYLYQTNGQRHAFSGLAPKKQIQNWLSSN